jgi:Concanavalin A-like lectin/glucanases superfamily
MRSTYKGLLAGLLVVSASLPLLIPQSKSSYIAAIQNTSNTAATANFFTCNGAYLNRSASILFTYPMTEASASTAANDVSGKAVAGIYTGTMVTSSDARPGCPRDTPTNFYQLNGTSSYLTANSKATAPASFAAEVWFKSTSVSGGQLVGFGSSQTGNSTKHDRQAFLTNAGKVAFFVNPGTGVTVTSPLSYNDGKWHQVVAQMSSTAGMSLIVDGQIVATNSATKTGATGQGYWRFGNDALAGATGAPTSNFLAGYLRYAAVFSAVLTNAQISADYRAGT